MLVTLMGQLNAIRMRHDAAWGMMSINNARMGMIRNMNPSFGMNMKALNAMDTRMAIDYQKNGLMYQIACAQEDALRRQQQEENKRLNTFA